MKPETAGKIKYGSWGLVCGAVVAMIIGFGWGGWTTAATTQKMSEEAVLASQAAICVAQFMQDPNHEAKLTELKKVDSWKRAEFIEKGGWEMTHFIQAPMSSERFQANVVAAMQKKKILGVTSRYVIVARKTG